MAESKARLSLKDVRASVKRMQTEGERLVTRLRRDARAFATRSRRETVSNLLSDARRLQVDLRKRAEKAIGARGHADTHPRHARGSREHRGRDVREDPERRHPQGASGPAQARGRDRAAARRSLQRARGLRLTDAGRGRSRRPRASRCGGGHPVRRQTSPSRRSGAPARLARPSRVPWRPVRPRRARRAARVSARREASPPSAQIGRAHV